MTGTIWFDTAGDDTRSTILLIHGSMDRSAGLLRLGRRLDDAHRVVRIDRRGYGRSVDIGPPWTIEANVDDIETLTSTAAITGPIDVIGHSLGGNVALALAARRPDLVRSVVAYETPLSWLEWWPGDSAGAAAMAAASPAEAAEAFVRRLVGDEKWEQLPEPTRAQRRAEGAAMVAELADLRRAAPWAPEAIEMPVLVVRGEHGRPHHRRGAEWLGARLDGCRTAVVAGAGHAGPHTHAAEVAAEVVTFLRSLPDAGPGAG
jgi:pimeloyl-ACP methyl ester carboxylesterase